MYENGHMTASATIDTPLYYKVFEVISVQADCSDEGWVILREGRTKRFLRMVPFLADYHNETMEGYSVDNTWAVINESFNLAEVKTDHSYHFLLEKEGYILNRGMYAFVNVIANQNFLVRGHATSSWSKPRPARREVSASIRFDIVTETAVQAAVEQESNDRDETRQLDTDLLAKIKKFPTSTEVRVISFGLYGSNEKYTEGAIRNTELAPIYFPGWICRFYYASDVPRTVLDKLRANGAELVPILVGTGYISGMFWRFLVASDSAVDRYIIRDTDSRLNSRDAMAVYDWIKSGYKVHILRDHVNQCSVMNGGMWGGTKGSIDIMQEEVEKWESKDEYLMDMNFLAERIWPLVKEKQISHDSYCCEDHPNTRPFPSRRPPTYLHVGQVFDKFDNERLSDIDGLIRGVTVPRQCRLHPDWIYG